MWDQVQTFSNKSLPKRFWSEVILILHVIHFVYHPTLTYQFAYVLIMFSTKIISKYLVTNNFSTRTCLRASMALVKALVLHPPIHHNWAQVRLRSMLLWCNIYESKSAKRKGSSSESVWNPLTCSVEQHPSHIHLQPQGAFCVLVFCAQLEVQYYHLNLMLKHPWIFNATQCTRWQQQQQQ